MHESTPRRIAMVAVLAASLGSHGCGSDTAAPGAEPAANLVLADDHLALQFDRIYFETAAGRVAPPTPFPPAADDPGTARLQQTTLPDGRIVEVRVTPQQGGFAVALSATPDDDIVGWGFAVEAEADEYFTGLMERVVDGPQRASWAPGITATMNLRGQAVEMIVKPTTSVYSPFYLSSRGYAIGMGGTWPGNYDFAAADAERVLIDWEGPGLAFDVDLADDPAELVRAHAMAVGS
jgi:hypothetical protein